MANILEIKNGQVVDNTKTKKEEEAKSGTKNAYDKEMFLKLLVAEMQYQDPLEPTSNTEYVAELASFSQIEAVQAVQDQMSTIEANSLVGKYVILNTTNSLGNQEWVSGKVDYITQDEEGNMMLSVNDELYSIDDLDSVADEEYYIGVNQAALFHDTVDQLPSLTGLTIHDEDKLAEARKIFDDLTDYQLQFVSKDDLDKLEALEAQMEKLKKEAEGDKTEADA